MGTPDFSVPVLEALVAAGHEIACVYCQPPRPAGRGKKLRPTPIQARAEALGLVVRHPLSFKEPGVVSEFAAFGADLAVVVAYGLILPQTVLDATNLWLRKYSCIPAAALAWGGTYSPRYHVWRCRDRGLHHANGGRVGYRAGIGAPKHADWRC